MFAIRLCRFGGGLNDIEDRSGLRPGWLSAASWLLVALTDRPDRQVRVRDLAQVLQWEKSRLSHHLGRMERRGLIERQDCPDDARGAFVILTAAGRAAIERAAPAHVATVRSLVFDGLDPEHVDTLAGIAEIVLDRIRGCEAHPGGHRV